MGQLIKVSGEIEDVCPEEGMFTLDELRRYVGCDLIEIVRTTDVDVVLVIDDSGKLKNKPYNAKASEWADIPAWDYIAGNALAVVFKEEIE